MLDMAVQQRWKLMSFHSVFPGLMYIDNAGTNFITTAVNYEASANAMTVCEEPLSPAAAPGSDM